MIPPVQVFLYEVSFLLKETYGDKQKMSIEGSSEDKFPQPNPLRRLRKKTAKGGDLSRSSQSSQSRERRLLTKARRGAKVTKEEYSHRGHRGHRDHRV
jgi:hypothetical protein